MFRKRSRTALAGLVCLGAVLVFAGCGGGNKQDTAQNTPADGAPEPAPVLTDNPPETPTTDAPAQELPKPAPPRPKPEAPREDPKPKAPAEVTLLSGTTVKAALQGPLTSHESKAGQSFTLVVSEPVVVDGWVALAAGSVVHGEVVAAKESGKIDGRGEITLAFKSVTDAAGATHPIEAESFFAQAEGAGDRDAAMVAGGAAAGAIIGGIVGGKKGAGIGGLIGAAAGTGTVLATKGPEVKLGDGQLFEIKLTKSVSIPPGPKVS
jgi:hypothetical protein